MKTQAVARGADGWWLKNRTTRRGTKATRSTVKLHTGQSGQALLLPRAPRPQEHH